LAEPERSSANTNGHVRKVYAPALQAVAHTASEIRRVDQVLIQRARERPLTAVAIALATGYVVGRIFSRWG
jgi:hypothetical protein